MFRFNFITKTTQLSRTKWYSEDYWSQ